VKKVMAKWKSERSNMCDEGLFDNITNGPPHQCNWW
jgi:hypothetical protein